MPAGSEGTRIRPADRVQIRRVTGRRQARRLHRIFREYARGVGPHFRWEGFDAEVRGLPGAYVPPDGSLLAATVGHRIAGMVATRRWSRTVCEMKRLYVRPAFRGRGLGHQLVDAILAEARRLGYARMRLDTLHFMKGAQAIYRQHGFRRIRPYLPSPGCRTYYFELRL